ncbi:MAG: ribonuclease P protein component [Actinomycetota bacterium]|nr:ribonuclease P protein component [Actinomycetota bacterium]
MLWRVRDRSTFVELRRRGRRVRAGYLTLTWVPRPEGTPPQVAFAVGRAVGSAVVRNRVRRRLRSALGQRAGDLPAGAYLLGVAPEAASASPEDLRSNVGSVIAALRHRAEGSAGEVGGS